MSTTRVYYANNAIYIDGIDLPIVAGTLTARMIGDQVLITADSRSYALTSITWDQVADMVGSTFDTPDAAMAYLQDEFGKRRPVGETFCTALVASDDFDPGLPLAVSRSTGLLVAARADSKPLAFVVGLASQAVVAGFATLPAHGAVTLTDWTLATGRQTLFQGVPYFLGSEGGLTVSPFSSPGQCVTRVGIAASPTTLIVQPADPISL